MTPNEYLKNKKVLVMGLGLLGGGIATTKWLVKHGAQVTVTDLKTKKDLTDSIKALGQVAKKAKPCSDPTKGGSTAGIRFVLGQHNESDFKAHDMVVVNPAVPRESPYLKIARQNKVQLENEASLFFKFCKNPIIGVTGTRGKTTTVNWIHHFLKQKFPHTVLTGNSSDNPMLNVLDGLDEKSPVVVELSSWHLELLPQSQQAPHIAIITNIFPDHLNRYKNITAYAQAKTGIFTYQTKNDFLILNKKNPWTKFFLKQKLSGKTIFISPLAPFLPLAPFTHLGEHNVQNLITAATAANLAGVSWALIKKAVKTLPQIKFRQEIVYDKNGLTIINDATATSPDATIAALKRFAPLLPKKFMPKTEKNRVSRQYSSSKISHAEKRVAGFGSTKSCLILLTGGTDKNLDFKNWAQMVKKYIKKENLFLLEGSATKKMIMALDKIKYFEFDRPNVFDDFQTLLTASLECAKLKKQKSIVLFSPSGASFEKFKNEFDRGKRFDQFFKKETR